MNRAVFLDRDGVLIEDAHLLTRPDQVRVLPGVPEALSKLCLADFKLLVVSNQPVVARGLASEGDVAAVHLELAKVIAELNGPVLHQFYFCPHHPNATLPAYRQDCDCRKPKPGLLFRAAREWDVDLKASFLVGDRITDVMAGAKAGCRTVLVQTGKHLEKPIETAEPLDFSIQADHSCADLKAAAEWILKR